MSGKRIRKNVLGNGKQQEQRKGDTGSRTLPRTATIHYGPHAGKARSGGRRKAKEHRELSPITDGIDFQSRSDGTALLTIICLATAIAACVLRVPRRSC